MSSDRRTFLRIAAGAAGFAGCSAPKRGAGAEGRPTYRNPAFEEVFADPTAVRAADGAFYAYATFQP